MGIVSKFRDYLSHASKYNPFSVDENLKVQSWGGTAGGNYGVAPSMLKRRVSQDKTVITSIYNKMAIDVASVKMLHVRIDRDTDAYQDTIDSGLNDCLSFEANIDEGGRAFRQNMAMALFDKGVAAVCIMEATEDPATSMAYDIKQLRIGEVVAWFPQHVRVSVYDEDRGKYGELTLPKRQVAIIENPLYAVMNDDNSTLKRLTRKLSLLDAIDEQSGSGKLDIIIQLPYVVKSESRKTQAAARRQDMEDQLKNSKYGVAYADATEKITQLNRPAENNMLAQVEFLMTQLYSQLGITKEVFEGTASVEVQKAYYNSTIEPILTAIAENIERKFISKTERSQGQAIRFYRDPFRDVTLANAGDLSDKLARNEVLSSNEIRSGLGFRPSKEAKADKLQNSNMPDADKQTKAEAPQAPDAQNPPSDPTQERKVNLQNDSGQASP